MDSEQVQGALLAFSEPFESTPDGLTPRDEDVDHALLLLQFVGAASRHALRIPENVNDVLASIDGRLLSAVIFQGVERGFSLRSEIEKLPSREERPDLWEEWGYLWDGYITDLQRFRDVRAGVEYLAIMRAARNLPALQVTHARTLLKFLQL